MSDPAVDAALEFLRAHLTAEMTFDEHVRAIKFIIAPDGRLVAPVMVAMLQAAEIVLFLPDSREGAMELMVSMTAFDEHGPDGALADRWRIYHGEPEDIRWAKLDIDGARHDGLVIDGDALMRPNALGPHEGAICKSLNQDKDALRRLVNNVLGMEIEEPVAVGADERGLHIRARFDVVRVPFPNELTSLEGVAEFAKARSG